MEATDGQSRFARPNLRDRREILFPAVRHDVTRTSALEALVISAWVRRRRPRRDRRQLGCIRSQWSLRPERLHRNLGRHRRLPRAGLSGAASFSGRASAWPPSRPTPPDTRHRGNVVDKPWREACYSVAASHCCSLNQVTASVKSLQNKQRREGKGRRRRPRWPRGPSGALGCW